MSAIKTTARGFTLLELLVVIVLMVAVIYFDLLKNLPEGLLPGS